MAGEICEHLLSGEVGCDVTEEMGAGRWRHKLPLPSFDKHVHKPLFCVLSSSKWRGEAYVGWIRAWTKEEEE